MENAHIRLVVYREREFSDVVAQATREGGQKRAAHKDKKRIWY